MGIGLGVVLLILGLIETLQVTTFDIPYVNDQALGWVLLIVGIVTIVLVLVMNAQRSRTKQIVENRTPGRTRYDDGTTRYTERSRYDDRTRYDDRMG